MNVKCSSLHLSGLQNFSATAASALLILSLSPWTAR